MNAILFCTLLALTSFNYTAQIPETNNRLLSPIQAQIERITQLERENKQLQLQVNHEHSVQNQLIEQRQSLLKELNNWKKRKTNFIGYHKNYFDETERLVHDLLNDPLIRQAPIDSRITFYARWDLLRKKFWPEEYRALLKHLE